MQTFGELMVAFAILVGLVGIVVPVLPGLLLVVGAVVVWAVMDGGSTAWGIALLSIAIAGVGSYVKYSVPKRRLNAQGIPTRTLVMAVVIGSIGFFVIPVLGGPLGFVGWIYMSERTRVGPDAAWPATKASLSAVATSIGIELAAGMVIAALWFGANALG
jgi:uncharacterized protein